MDKGYATQLLDKDSFTEKKSDAYWVKRYQDLKNLIKNFVYQYEGRALVIKAGSGMGKRHLLHWYGKKVGLEKLFGVKQSEDGSVRQKLICSLPGNLGERELFSALNRIPHALVIFENPPSRIRLGILSDALKNRSVISNFQGGFAIMCNADEAVDRVAGEFELFDLGNPGFENVLAIARSEKESLNAWLKETGATTEQDIDAWAEDVKEVLFRATRAIGMSGEDVDEYFYFSLSRFVQLMVKCPEYISRGSQNTNSRRKWIAHDLHLDALSGMEHH